MKKRYVALSALVVSAAIACTLVLPGVVAAADAGPLLKKVKAALEPPRPSVRKLLIHVLSGSTEVTQLKAAEARKRANGSTWMLTVMLAPPEARGSAFLAADGKVGGPDQWIYIPFLHRVREITPLSSWEPFFGTDFTYADFGFFRTRSKNKLVGKSDHNGTAAFEIDSIPPPNLYFSKIVSWIDASNYLPLERDFYDLNNNLWKVETYTGVQTIQGVPTFTKVSMVDKEQNSSTTIDVSDIKYDAQIPDDLFDPAKLGQNADHPFWK